MSRDPFVDGLFPICVATHDQGIRRLFDLATVLMLLQSIAHFLRDVARIRGEDLP